MNPRQNELIDRVTKGKRNPIPISGTLSEK